MNNLKNYGVDKEGWVRCPFCGGKTRTKVRIDSLLRNFPLYCPKCKQEVVVDIEDRKVKSY